jgi:hypothetical protein
MSTPKTAAQLAGRSAAIDMLQAATQHARTQHARYLEGRAAEAGAYRSVRALAETAALLHHLADDELTALERHLKGLRLEADLQAGRAKDVVQASTDLIGAVIAEWRTR